MLGLERNVSVLFLNREKSINIFLFQPTNAQIYITYNTVFLPHDDI